MNWWKKKNWKNKKRNKKSGSLFGPVRTCSSLTGITVFWHSVLYIVRRWIMGAILCLDSHKHLVQSRLPLTIFQVCVSLSLWRPKLRYQLACFLLFLTLSLSPLSVECQVKDTSALSFYSFHKKSLLTELNNIRHDSLIML